MLCKRLSFHHVQFLFFYHWLNIYFYILPLFIFIISWANSCVIYTYYYHDHDLKVMIHNERDLDLLSFISLCKSISWELFPSSLWNLWLFLSEVVIFWREILLNLASVLVLIYYSCFCSIVWRIFVNGIFLSKSCNSSVNNWSFF